MHNAFILVILLQFYSAILRGQQTTSTPIKKQEMVNLVLNPGFDDWADSSMIYTREGRIESAKFWTTPDGSMPFLIATHTNGYIYDRYGNGWKFNARSGKNVAGVDVDTERDYIQGQLSQPLTVGQKYYFFFFVHYHCSGANGIGIAFLPQKIELKPDEKLQLEPATYQRNLTKYSELPDKTWSIVVDSFIAQRPYQYFVIGNFLPENQTLLERRVQHYYAFVDDVFVMKANNPKMPENRTAESEEEKKKWRMNDSVIVKRSLPSFIEKIQFKYDSDEILIESYSKLDSVVTILSNFPTIRLLIKGHTSSEGSSSYNEKLSQKRAIAVMNYLTRKGIETSRLSAIGKGSSEPKVPNETSESQREMNRRVEFEIVN